MLIYHTHTGESYLDEDVDYFYESYYSRTNNNDFNVVAVGDAITEVLEKNGIKTLHDTTVHDSTYNGSYDRSAQTVYDDMEKSPDQGRARYPPRRARHRGAQGQDRV